MKSGSHPTIHFSTAEMQRRRKGVGLLTAGGAFVADLRRIIVLCEVAMSGVVYSMV